MITYISDPLLKRKRLYINNKLNLYSALVKAEDFKTPARLMSLPFCYNSNFKEFLNKLKEKYKKDDFLYLRLLHERYAKNKAFSKLSSFKRWYETDTFPLSFIRAVSLCFRDNKIMSEFLDSEITNSHHKNMIRFPSNKKELLNQDLIYLCGCITGDGYVRKDTLIKIVDGHSREVELKYSKLFMEKISKKVNEIFNYNIKSIRRKGNLYEIHIVSKWIVRFLRFFFEIPYSPKKEIEWPKIVAGHEKFYLRGLFDTDGGIHKDSKFIIFKSASKEFIDNIRSCVLGLGLTPGELKTDNFGSYYFPIYAHDMKRFSNNIGFSHPRKRQYLLDHLKKGASDKTFFDTNRMSTYNNYFDLALVHDLRVLDLGNMIKQLRINRNLTQNEFAKELGVKRRNFARYENNVLAVPIKTLIRIFSFKDKLYGLISETNPRFGLGGRNFVKFPINLDKIDTEIYMHLSPVKDNVIIRKRYKGYVMKEKDVQEIKNKVEKYFGIKSCVRKGKSDDIIILSKTLSILLETFFVYSTPWKPVKK
jgi:transcriptional regulator with XRE-family HTH domain